MKYDIEAKPTMYNGRLYRSRLEARWAAFFDLLGMRFEYEPIDLPGWSPDFRLHDQSRTWLVEIKPPSITKEEQVAIHRKMLKATNNSPLLLFLTEPFADEFMPDMFGMTPLARSTYTHEGVQYFEFIEAFVAKDLLAPPYECPYQIYNFDEQEYYDDLNEKTHRRLKPLWIESANKVMFLKPNA